MCQSESEKQDLEMIESAAVEISTYPFVQDVKIREYKCVMIDVEMRDTDDIDNDRDTRRKIYELQYDLLRYMKSNLNLDVEINTIGDNNE